LSKKRKARLRLVVVFDAMPKLWDCVSGCHQKEDHLCKHRFPSGVRVIAHTKHLSRPGLSDLHVVMHVMKLMGWGIAGARPGTTRWALFTSDRTFWESARHEYESMNGKAPPGLRFPSKRRICTEIQGKDVCLEIKYVPHAKEGPDRDIRLRRAFERAKQLLVKRPT